LDLSTLTCECRLDERMTADTTVIINLSRLAFIYENYKNSNKVKKISNKNVAGKFYLLLPRLSYFAEIFHELYTLIG
jgi:hypothetical protein